jgi:hypothetical protein
MPKRCGFEGDFIYLLAQLNFFRIKTVPARGKKHTQMPYIKGFVVAQKGVI